MASSSQCGDELPVHDMTCAMRACVHVCMCVYIGSVELSTASHTAAGTLCAGKAARRVVGCSFSCTQPAACQVISFWFRPPEPFSESVVMLQGCLSITWYADAWCRSAYHNSECLYV